MWFFFFLSLFLSVTAQQPGKLIANEPLPLSITVDGTRLATLATIDANWRWIHDASGSNCFSGKWVCSGSACDQCLVEGVSTADYLSKYGASSDGKALTLKYVTQTTYGTNIGSRFYLLNPDGESYYGFKLLGKEFSYDVDVSQLPCGLNGALYFVSVPLDGEKSSINKAGAPFGTGYGDAQCTKGIKFTGGVVNTADYGACSQELDVWEANSEATAFAPHTCANDKVELCKTDVTCGNGANRYLGLCDKDGTDFNLFRNGFTNMYGKGKMIDTSKPFTVTTRFHTDASGHLARVQQLYVQNGKTIWGGNITDASTIAQKKKFGENNHFGTLGGMKRMGEIFEDDGAVIALSLWDDTSPAQMKWLDSTFPEGSTAPGALRGRCTGSSDPTFLRAQFPNSQVIYSNLRINSIGGASSPTPPPTPSPSCPPCPPCPSVTPTPTPTSAPSGPCSKQWEQCGGIGWKGPTCCTSPFSCKKSNDWYSQCL